tara:strand:+ start:28716 stop:29216 length:501 start_codon:yes stop_codon:yes gene_type:complete
MRIRIENSIQQLEDIQFGKLWMGANFSTKIKAIDEKSAFTRPHENLHSVAEILSHLTLWRKETILKIQTGEGSKTDECEENWLTNDQLKIVGWQYIKTEYNNTLTSLIKLLKFKDDAFLDKEYYDTDFKGNYKYSFVINGMLHHDIYHLGQLGIIIKYLKKNKLSS